MCKHPAQICGDDGWVCIDTERCPACDRELIEMCCIECGEVYG